jgi:hypothetical protein
MVIDKDGSWDTNQGGGSRFKYLQGAHQVAVNITKTFFFSFFAFAIASSNSSLAGLPCCEKLDREVSNKNVINKMFFIC